MIIKTEKADNFLGNNRKIPINVQNGPKNNPVIKNILSNFPTIDSIVNKSNKIPNNSKRILNANFTIFFLL